MRNDDRIRVRHMIDAAREATEFAKDRSRKDLGQDRMLALSLVKTIEIMGEAASKVSADLREEEPGIPWREMVAIRNRLIHGYFDINLDIVWQTVTNELPPLIAELEVILSKGEK